MKFSGYEGGDGVGDSWDPSGKGAEIELSRILNREIFLYFLDLEVKRARRYQNFFSILILKLVQLSNHDNSSGLHTSYKQLSRLVREELRESDILGSLGEDKLAALLPYADVSAGEQAKSHFEASLKYFDFEQAGYEVRIDQVCFPLHGTDTADLIKKVLEPEDTLSPSPTWRKGLG
jgi:GGDEF domain-containing protein